MGDREGQIALRLFDTALTGTVDENLYEPDAIAQHNFDEHPGLLHDLLDGLRATVQVVPDLRFEELRVHAADGVCTLQYVVRGSRPGDGFLEAPACSVVTFSERGRIATLFEYVNTAQFQAFFQALSTAAGPIRHSAPVGSDAADETRRG